MLSTIKKKKDNFFLTYVNINLACLNSYIERKAVLYKTSIASNA